MRNVFIHFAKTDATKKHNLSPLRENLMGFSIIPMISTWM